MLNGIFIFFIVVSVVVAAFTGTMPKLTEGSLAAAKTAVDIAIGLIGQMALWLGLMAVLKEAGLMRTLSRWMEPLMVRLFPEVPKDHPAMSAMILNIAANMLGIANAATPFGLQAMRELNKLNRRPGVATNAMALFLAINTAGVALLPHQAIAVRAQLGSKDPTGIIVPTILVTALSTVTAILVGKWIENWPRFSPDRYAPSEPLGDTPSPSATPALAQKVWAEAQAAARSVAPASGWRLWAVAVLWGVMISALVRHSLRLSETLGTFELFRSLLSDWLLPVLILGIVTFGFGRRVKVYEVFIQAAKEAFQITVTIIPYLVAILVAIGMFRSSGAMDIMARLLEPLTRAVGFPAEAVPMALVRPLSASGGVAVMTEIMKASGPDSFVGYLVSVINGSVETTFYVLAVYFGAIHIRELRHTVIPCLSADIAGIVGALLVCRLFFASVT